MAGKYLSQIILLLNNLLTDPHVQGMSLSGGDETHMQEKILDLMKTQYASLTHHTFIGSDTKSALATALPGGIASFYWTISYISGVIL